MFVRAGEVHAAPNKAQHVCGRPRDGERAVSGVSRQCPKAEA